jgi:hypothetical protein
MSRFIEKLKKFFEKYNGGGERDVICGFLKKYFTL